MDNFDMRRENAIQADHVLAQRVDMWAEQVRFLYRNATTGLFVNIALALLVIWILWDRVPQQVLMYWFASLMLITVLRAIMLVRFNQVQPVDSDIKGWCHVFFVGSTLTGMIWGATVWLFAPFDSPEIPVFLAFTLGGLMAGAAAILGAVLVVYFAYILVIMAPITAWFLLQPGDIYLFMGIMLCVAIIAFIATGIIYRKVLVSSIMLSNSLIDAKAEAEIANKAKSEFLARMSHELRTPLGAIRGFAETHKMDMAYSDVHRENTQDLLKASNQLLHSINDLLDLAKIEASMIDLNIIAVDCSSLIAECIELLTPLATANNVSINFNQQASAGITVSADHARLKQVLMKLLSNACKYNRPGGKVDVSCMPIENGKVRISVQDTGSGITPEQAKKLFRSYQYHGHEKSIIQGAGLGLMITKQLIEMMAGSVEFDSTPEQGSVFHVELPGGA